ncbi:MAG: sulfite exporter TauE/SafE family protein [bacterium]|nr:sulfite exporter TauE/SafE family protein [bacterium]MDT8366738.1 sulfite exporter TauE/SafE family protein [bacterium]
MLENPYFHLIIFIAGFTQGFTGFGSTLVLLPLLTMLTGVKTVVPMVVLLGICINVILVFQVHRHLEWKRVRTLLIACVPGILIGVFILKKMSTSFLELVIGLVLLVFPVWLMFRGVPEKEIAAGWAWPVGFLSGILGGSVSAGGPPVIIYTALQPWGKLPIKSTLVGFFLVTSVVTGVVQTGGGLMTKEVLMLFAAGLPALVTGVFAGSYLFNRVDSGVYRKGLSILLIFLGVVILLKAAVG